MAGIIAVFYTLSLAGSSCGRLVVNVEDVDGLTAAIIEKEATLVERLSRETDCAGVTVVLSTFNMLYTSFSG